MTSAIDWVQRAYARIEAVGRPDIWITVRPREEAVADAVDVDRRGALGERLPLAVGVPIRERVRGQEEMNVLAGRSGVSNAK